jgi:hypothetical protein
MFVKKNQGWIGVDLDGTLAYYDTWISFKNIGKPIEKMVTRVRQWIIDGEDVRIFTARISDSKNKELIKNIIENWCEEHIGVILPITNIKDFSMRELWDDRCIQVIKNTGEQIVEHGNDKDL